MQKEEYLELIEKISPKKDQKKTLFMSFFVGGLICAIGELFRQFFLFFGYSPDDCGLLASILIIFIAAILTGLGIFHRISNFAGAGTFVPITGFSNSIVSAALEFKTNGFVLGVGSNMFIIAGPVIVYGVLSSVVCGVVFYVKQLFGGVI